MPVDNAYYNKIVEMLGGDALEREGTPRERLDWAGSGAVLELYKKTAGSSRREIVDAMGKILGAPKEHSSAVIAQVIHIAASLDIAELEPSISELQLKGDYFGEPVRIAVNNYLAFRQLRAH